MLTDDFVIWEGTILLATIGFVSTAILLILLLTKKGHPAIIFILIPIIAGIISGVLAGNGAGIIASDLVTWLVDGTKVMAPNAVMFIFSIEFFGIMMDAGAFDPIVNRILRFVKNDPIRVTVGTALLGMVCHLDGSGATTFLIAIPPLLPIYDKLGMRRTTLATIVGLAAGTMNIVPWGGPTLRAATALEIDVTYLYNPLIIPQLVGLLFVIFIAFMLGKREKSRLGSTLIGVSVSVAAQTLSPEEQALRRPKLVIPNLILILVSVVVLLEGTVQPFIVFMIAFAIALIMNYRSVEEQTARINAHAVDAMMMAVFMFAAGLFTGVLQNAGMLTAMAEALVSVIPSSMGRFFPVLMGVFSMPMSLVFDTSSFYQGVLPVLGYTAEALGVDAVNVARAAVLGQMTTGFPTSPLTASTFLLVGLSGVSLGDHQRKMIPLAFATTILMLVVSIALGAIVI